MKKYIMTYITIVVSALTVLLMIGAMNHIRVKTTKVTKDYWQDGERHVTEETTESKFLTGEIIRTDTKIYTQFIELDEFFTRDISKDEGFEIDIQ